MCPPIRILQKYRKKGDKHFERREKNVLLETNDSQYQRF